MRGGVPFVIKDQYSSQGCDVGLEFNNHIDDSDSGFVRMVSGVSLEHASSEEVALALQS